jgi:hypothetical protein
MSSACPVPHMRQVYLSEARRFASSRASGGRIVRISASAPDLRFLIFFLIFFRICLGVGARDVFLGQPDKAVAQGEINGIAGQTPASLGLFAKVE